MMLGLHVALTSDSGLVGSDPVQGIALIREGFTVFR